jgi:hypothetical protein
MENFTFAANRDNMSIWFIKRIRNSQLCEPKSKVRRIAESTERHIFECESESLVEMWRALAAEMEDRRNVLDEYLSGQGITEEQSDFQKQCFDFLSAETKPILIMVESFADMCSVLDSISVLVLDKLFRDAQKRNIYVMGFFEPDDSKRANAKILYSGFNPDGNIMLFGGQFDKQILCDVQIEKNQAQPLLEYNLCLMKYKKKFHPLLMPCGEVASENIDSDAESIF